MALGKLNELEVSSELHVAAAAFLSVSHNARTKTLLEQIEKDGPLPFRTWLAEIGKAKEAKKWITKASERNLPAETFTEARSTNDLVRLLMLSFVGTTKVEINKGKEFFFPDGLSAYLGLEEAG